MLSGRNVIGTEFLVVATLMVACLTPTRALAQAFQDPTALELINQGLALLNGGTTLSDATLQGTVTYTSGSDVETGTAALQALNDVYSLVVLNLTGGQRQYVRNPGAGAWIDTSAQINPYALQNCWTDAAWFFPGLVFTSMPANPQVGLINLGAATWNGTSVNQVQIYQLLPGQQPTTPPASIQLYSTETISLDPTTALPLAIDFNSYPDDGSPGTIATEIQFNDYQTIQGMSVPLQVQKLINGSTLLTMTITSVVVNSGLTPNLFNIP